MKAFNLLNICVLALALAACSNGGGGKDGDGGTAANPNAVEWGSVPSEFNPRVETVEFGIQDVTKISTNLFGFSGDVHIRYSKALTDSGTLEIYSASKEARTSVSGVDQSRNGNTIVMRRYGSYECSIRVVNRRIEALKGACYVRLVLTLPMGSEIEYTNADKLISKRFIPISNVELLQALDKAYSSEKMGVIDAYVSSYVNGKKPALNSEELGTVIEEFAFAEEKFVVLRKLHMFVTDRENLNKMIEDSFSYFDRDNARRIVGIRR